MRPTSRNIDEYIARYPKDVQVLLEKIRAVIHKAAPRAEEAIKYQIPTFVLNGNLVFFAAFAKHVSIYPAPRGSKEFRKELSQYEGGKGTVRFPLDKPIPFSLITRIVKHRIKENLATAEARKEKKKHASRS